MLLRNQVFKRTFAGVAGRKAKASTGSKIDGVLKFYKDVQVVDFPGEDGSTAYGVTLDGRRVKTPDKKILALPTVDLAFAIAHEWDAQERQIRPATMPLMTLASTVLDEYETTQELVQEILHYVHSDTLCYQVTAEQQDKLSAHQQKKWHPIRTWFEEEFQGELDVSHGTIAKLQHDDKLVENIVRYLTKLEPFEIVPLRALTRECKSFIAAAALFKRHISPKEAIELARVEEEFQIGRWGLVEGGHDLDRVNIRVGVSSASLFLWLQDKANSTTA